MAEHDHSMVLAAAVFEKLKALHHAATPRNYEVWYTYASGSNLPLTQGIDALIAERRTLSQSDLDEVYERFLSPTRLVQQIDGLGNEMMGEVNQIMSVIVGALDKTSNQSAHLAAMIAHLDKVRDPNVLRAIINQLINAAKDIESTVRKFEEEVKESRGEIDKLHKHLEAVRTETLTDPLTTLGNRKYFDDVIAKATNVARSSGSGLALLMMDIDHFKKFNDTYGHLVGDQVLRLVARTLKQYVKGANLAARYGGEEFAAILPGVASQDAADFAEQIRRAVSVRELTKRTTGEILGRVTISIGVAVLNGDDTIQTLIERADKCLYAAKRSGRNRVVSGDEFEDSRARANVA
jgi:diguanylate cyclase